MDYSHYEYPKGKNVFGNKAGWFDSPCMTLITPPPPKKNMYPIKNNWQSRVTCNKPMNERQFSPRKLTKALSYLRILVRLYDANKPGFVAGVL